MRAVPATVRLRDAGVLGLAGPADQLTGLLRWVVLQLAIHHPPRDLALTLLAPRARADWNWLRWLPHARPADGDGAVAFVGNDPETVAARVAELVALVKGRREAAGSGRVQAEAFPAHVVVVHGFRALRATPGLAQVLQDGPAVGVYAVCGDEEERFLPEAATATAVFDPEDDAALLVRRSGHDPVPAVLAEPVSAELAEAAARALAPLRDVSIEDDDAVLPDSVRLLDLLGWSRRPWTACGPAGSSRAGARGWWSGRAARAVHAGPAHRRAARAGGRHHRRGQVELLQTMIASLAVANRPDALNFVLIDYKGGSAFKDCASCRTPSAW